jgi:glycosyltransferase involved in cell wall biosynthesis
MVLLLKKKVELIGHEVVECQDDVNISLEKLNIFSIAKTFVNLFLKHRKISYDIVVLPMWWGAIQLPLLKLISKKPIIYYAYVSPYDELVNDRKKVKSTSIIAKIFFRFEKYTWKNCNLIIKESQAEIDYYVKMIGVSKYKFRKLFIGADEAKFPECPFKKSQNEFVVLFFGTFIPLHGIEKIIEAAKILQSNSEIIFKLCGDGQTKQKIEELIDKNNLTNVKLLGFVSHSELLKNIQESDVCLGIFGDGDKASYVVTNKVYQILCSQKPLITMESKAIEEINLINKKNCMLVSKDNPEMLVEAITFLKNNSTKRKEIALEARKLYLSDLSLEKTSQQLSNFFEELSKTENR